LTIYNAAKAHFSFLKDLPMNRLHTTAALMVLALATPGCTRNRNLPTQLAPSNVTTLAINSYLWRAAVDTVSFAPLLQANAQSGVIITDWYTNPKAPGERVKLTVAVLDPDLRADALRVSAAKQVYQNGAWVDAPVTAATVQKLEDIILTRARDLRRSTIPGADYGTRTRGSRTRSR
jgi:Domain of unknown function (DUF3576)